MRHSLTAEEVRRIFAAQDLSKADRVASEIEHERERADKEGRCYWHGRVECGRCIAAGLTGDEYANGSGEERK